MSRISKKKDEDEKLTVSKVYETLKSRQFLRNLYWDVLSDLKEKPTFKQMRETIKKIVNEKLDTLETLSANTSDSEVEKSIVNEICSMAITVDTVYSKILFMQLEKVFNSQILNIIKDLRNDGKIPDDVWTELEIPNTSVEKSKEINNSPKKKTETSVKPSTVYVKKGKKIIGSEDKNIQNQKNATKDNTENEKLSENKMKTRSHAIQKNSSPVSISTPKKKLPGKSNSNDDEEIDVVNFQAGSQDSDTDSNISVGHRSLASVSSVHTSDLSSFDDEISMSSNEGTRKVSLKEIVSQKVAGKVNGFKKVTPKSTQENHHNPSPHVHQVPSAQTSIEATNKRDEATNNESLASSSKRVRKPNSKYSSDTIVCHSVKVKERKKSNVSTKNEDKKNSSEISPKRKKNSDTEEETPKKMQKIDNVQENKSSDNKVPSKQNESSDLYKPIPSVRPLTSRRTAPITLYSTTS